MDLQKLMTGQPIFKKVEACKYDYCGTGYFVEKLANGEWVAYLPVYHDGGYGDPKLWSSRWHFTRNAAASAISMERRRIAVELKKALA